MDSFSVCIIPSAGISWDVHYFKNELKEIFGKFPGQTSAPSIILFSFDADAEKLKLFDKKIKMVCSNFTPFTIHCNGFDEFYWNKTIYICPDNQSKEHITRLRNTLSLQLKHGKYDTEVDFNAGKTPHITIARTLTEDRYAKAKKYFYGRKYDAGFNCSSLALQKLISGQGFTKYEVIKTYPFAAESLSLF